MAKFTPTEMPTTLILGPETKYLSGTGLDKGNGEFWTVKGKTSTGDDFHWFAGKWERDKLLELGAKAGNTIKVFKTDSGKVSNKTGRKLFDTKIEVLTPGPQAPQKEPPMAQDQPKTDWWERELAATEFMLGIAKERFTTEEAQQAHFASLHIAWGMAGRPSRGSK